MKVKLRMISHSYKENAEKKTVTAIIKTESIIGYNRVTLTSVGIAKCDDKDVYDIEKGKRIARAKAEKDAYVQHKSLLNKFLDFLEKTRQEALDNKWKIERYIEHQNEYIKSF